MRHRKKNKKLDRDTSHRRALLKNLTKSLFLHNKLITTAAKAKYLRPFAERLITIGKNNSLSTRRILIKKLGDEKITKKILEEISPKYKERKGGYTRMIKIGFRKGDSAEIVQIELI